MADAWDDIDWSKFTQYSDNGTDYLVSSPDELPYGFEGAPFIDEETTDQISLVADGTTTTTTKPSAWQWLTDSLPGKIKDTATSMASGAIAGSVFGPGVGTLVGGLAPQIIKRLPGDNAMLPGAENATPEQLLTGQFYPGLPENGSDRYATDPSGALVSSGTVTTGIPNTGLEVMPRVVRGSGSDDRISQPFWEWGGQGGAGGSGSNVPTVDRFGRATGPGNPDGPTIEQARAYASGTMPGAPMGSPAQQRFAAMVEQMEAGTYQPPTGSAMSLGAPGAPGAPQSMIPRLPGAFTPGGVYGGGYSGAGFDSFVPQTAGIAGERSKAFFEQAGRIESAAGELDLSPLLSAGKQKFDLARQRVNESKTKALGDMNAMFERNRIAGSSLAADRMVLASKEFEKQQRELDVEEATFSAQTKLQEITTKADLMQKASATRVQAYQSQIDDVMKVASLGAQNAQVQMAMQDSANRLYGVLASLEAQRTQIEMQIQAKEAESIRNSLTQIDVAGISADTAKRNADIMAASENARTKLERDQGIGQLISPITSGLMQGAANWLLGTGPTYGLKDSVEVTPGTQGAISKFFTS